MYRFAAKASATTLKGALLDRDGNTLAQYSLALPFTTADNAGYLANQKDMKDAIETALGDDAHKCVAFTVQASLLGNVLGHTGARANVPVTADTLPMDDQALLGAVD